MFAGDGVLEHFFWGSYMLVMGLLYTFLLPNIVKRAQSTLEYLRDGKVPRRNLRLFSVVGILCFCFGILLNAETFSLLTRGFEPDETRLQLVLVLTLTVFMLKLGWEQALHSWYWHTTVVRPLPRQYRKITGFTVMHTPALRTLNEWIASGKGNVTEVAETLAYLKQHQAA